VAVYAQATSDIDIITGVILGSNAKPLRGASIDAIDATSGLAQHTTSNSSGFYQLSFFQGSGRYQVTIKAVGVTPKIAIVNRRAEDDRIVLNATFNTAAVRLQDLVAHSRLLASDMHYRETASTGSSETFFGHDEQFRYPVDPTDFAALAALVAGVTLVPAGDSVAQFSVAGQGTSANNYVVNGVTGSGTPISADAVRSVRVITNSADMARAGFSGGQIIVNTKSGFGPPTGTFSGRFGDRHLDFDVVPGPFGSGVSTQNISGGLGAALIPKVLAVFGSATLSRAVLPVRSLDVADNAALARLAVSPYSARRFIGVVEQLEGSDRVVDPAERAASSRVSGMLRTDLSENHTYWTLTLLGSRSNAPATGSGPTQLLQTGSTSHSSSFQATSAFTARFGQLIDYATAGWTRARGVSDPLVVGAAGQVRIASPADSGQQFAELGFGGSSSLSGHTGSDIFELNDELSLITGAHRLALSGRLNINEASVQQGANQYGTYSYNSLADLVSGTPATYTRAIGGVSATGRTYATGFSLTDAWRPRARALTGAGHLNPQLQLGLRVEHSWYASTVPVNGDVFNAFGINTSALPEETALLPGVALGISIPRSPLNGKARPQLGYIRAGYRVYRNAPSTGLPLVASAHTGLATAANALDCIGAGIDTPDWSTLLSGTMQGQASCGESGSGAAGPVAQVAAFAPGYRAPRRSATWLTLNRDLSRTATIALELSYNAGSGITSAEDRNLRALPAFTLTSEGGRPFYGDASEIDPATGAIALMSSRQNAAYGVVDLLTSDRRSANTQAALTFTLEATHNLSLGLSYTWLHAEDDGGSPLVGIGIGEETAGDPRAHVWSPSAAPRSVFKAQIAWSTSPSVELTGSGSLSSPSRYSPIVLGDVNGDGITGNDLAYVFPTTTASGAVVGVGMRTLIAGASANVRSCLLSQAGQIASRNSCLGDWHPALDFQLNVRPSWHDRRMQLSLVTTNLLAGVDRLVHGANDLHGWGSTTSFVDNALLVVTGFNRASQTFQYAVNNHFGATSAVTAAPVQLTLVIRYAIGHDPLSELMGELTGPKSRQSDSTRADSIIVQRLKDTAPDLAQQVLVRSDTLALLPTQIDQLRAISDSWVQRTTPLWASVHQMLRENHGTLDPSQAIAVAREIVDLRATAATAVHGVLSNAQWAILPASIRQQQ
jgi:hypothetical protein